ncbi:MAG: hypothetical protein LBB38_01635, partial [Puniceicoccales bacterium]|nr:hypothetical protein [Puniceicoccales bacterium]
MDVDQHTSPYRFENAPKTINADYLSVPSGVKFKADDAALFRDLYTELVEYQFDGAAGDNVEAAQKAATVLKALGHMLTRTDGRGGLPQDYNWKLIDKDPSKIMHLDEYEVVITHKDVDVLSVKVDLCNGKKAFVRICDTEIEVEVGCDFITKDRGSWQTYGLGLLTHKNFCVACLGAICAKLNLPIDQGPGNSEVAKLARLLNDGWSSAAMALFDRCSRKFNEEGIAVDERVKAARTMHHLAILVWDIGRRHSAGDVAKRNAEQLQRILRDDENEDIRRAIADESAEIGSLPQLVVESACQPLKSVTNKMVATPRDVREIERTPEWKLICNIYGNTEESAAETMASLAKLSEELDAPAVSAEERESREKAFVLNLRRVLLGKDGGKYNARNKFDMYIDSPNPGDPPPKIDCKVFLSIIHGIRAIGKYVPAAEMITFRTKIDLMLASIDESFVPDFGDFNEVFGEGKAIHVTNGNFIEVIKKTRKQIEVLTAARAGGADDLRITRGAGGWATVGIPDDRLNPIAGRLYEIVSKKSVSGLEIGAGMTGISHLNQNMLGRYVAEIVASDLAPIHLLDDFNPATNEVDRDILRLVASSTSVQRAKALTLSGDDPESWRHVLDSELQARVRPYESFFATRMEEDGQRPSILSYMHRRELGILSIFQDFMKDLDMCIPVDGKPSEKYEATVSMLQKVASEECCNLDVLGKWL